MFPNRYSAGEIHFNLMALVSDRTMTYQNKIAEVEKKMQVSHALRNVANMHETYILYYLCSGKWNGHR